MPHIVRFRRPIVLVFLFLAALTGVATYTVHLGHMAELNKNKANAGKKATAVVENSIQVIDVLLARTEAAVFELVREIESGRLAPAGIEQRLPEILRANTRFYGVAAAFAPFAYSKDRELYAPYYRRTPQGSCRMAHVETEYDYTVPEHDWYHLPLKNGAQWIRPYYGKAARSMMVCFAAPFYLPSREKGRNAPSGVVVMDVALKAIESMLRPLDFGGAGYGMILSSTGRFISHPMDEFIRSETTIFEAAEKYQVKGLKAVAQKVLAQTSGIIEYMDPLFEHPAWWAFETIPRTQWKMVAVFKEDAMLHTPKEARRHKSVIAMGGVLALLFLGLALLRLGPFSSTRVAWISVALISTALCLSIASIWFATECTPEYHGSSAYRITDKGRLDKVRNWYLKLAKERHYQATAFIPTGIFIQSIEFSGGSEAVLTGYVWQKYYFGRHDGIPQGFLMPEAKEFEASEAYRRKRADYELVGWYFTATLRERFDYQEYPLDVENIWIRLWHTQIGGNVVLVPDLEAYNLTMAAARPGLEEDLILPGWNIVGSFFGYRFHDYNADFGMENYMGLSDSPELYFNILLKRDFLGPFITGLLPAIVVAVILFSLQLVVTKKKADALGFSALDVMGGVAGLFFAVLIAQTELRSSLETTGIVYLEYFFLTLYLFLLLVALNAYLFTTTDRFAAIQYQDNLIPKLLFWPLLLGILLIITLFCFL